MKRTAAAVVVVLLAGPAWAQSAEITRYVVAGGGGTMTSAVYTLTGTIGQAEAGPTLMSGTFELRGGFWANGSTGSRLCADQNGDGLVSPSDFNAWILNYNTQDPRADTNRDGVVSPADFNAWILAFNQGAAGPRCDS